MASTLWLNASIHGHCDIFRAGRSFFWRRYRPAQDIPSGISGRYCERLRKVDYSSYEFTVDLGKPNDKYGITDRQLSVYHYERIRFLMYKKKKKNNERGARRRPFSISSRDGSRTLQCSPECLWFFIFECFVQYFVVEHVFL